MISNSLLFLDPPTQAHQYQNPSVAGYAFVGEGICKDASGNDYDYYYKTDVATNTDCATACEGIGKDGLRGFYSYSNNCRCLFDGGVVDYPTPDGFDEILSLFYSGTGEIASSDGTGGYYCYKIDVSNLLLVHPMEV